MQYTSHEHKNHNTPCSSSYHAILYVHCNLLIVHYFQCFDDCFFSVGVDLGDEFNLTSEECYIVIVGKASTPSLIMSVKSQFPLILAYACLGCHHDTFYR